MVKNNIGTHKVHCIVRKHERTFDERSVIVLILGHSVVYDLIREHWLFSIRFLNEDGSR